MTTMFLLFFFFILRFSVKLGKQLIEKPLLSSPFLELEGLLPSSAEDSIHYPSYIYLSIVKNQLMFCCFSIFIPDIYFLKLSKNTHRSKKANPQSNRFF